jgi:hypothetical protein
VHQNRRLIYWKLRTLICYRFPNLRPRGGRAPPKDQATKGVTSFAHSPSHHMGAGRLMMMFLRRYSPTTIPCDRLIEAS